MRNIRVISSDKDGTDLRREEVKNKYTIRCHGITDSDEINDAIQSIGNTKWFGIGNAWDRIFGSK